MEESSKKYSAMTVNERLFEAGLLNDFDKAVKKRNISKLLEILTKVELTHEQAQRIIDNKFRDKKNNI